MNKILLLILFVSFITFDINAKNVYWGQTGHRVIGQIAQDNLSRKARKKINKLLDGMSLAMTSTFGDEIKSDRKYKNFSSWHYVNFPLDGDYESSKKSPYGDIIMGIDSCITVLKDPKASKNDKVFYLKFLVHLVGDIHQPLHIGRKEDKGGNTIQVEWFGRGTNLHRVWDSNMIDQYDMTYTELAENTKKLSKAEKKKIQNGTVLDWVKETRVLTKEVYNSANVGENLKYKYMYDHFGKVRTQLQKGGLRLAALLNKIYS